MKNLLIALIFALPMLSFAGNEAAITTAISKGDVETLSKYFDETVEICIIELEDMLDKDEAKSQIKTFFAANQPKSFQVVHNGTSKGQDSRYFIGEMKTVDNTFRVYVYMKNSDDAYLIQEIRFEKK